MRSLRSEPAGVPEARLSDRAAIGILFALSLPLFFVKLGAAGLVDPDEPYYAVPALEMLKSGAWAVPVFRGEPWFDKPVLFYWMILAAFKTFGVSEWAARVGSALAGVGGAVSIVAWAPSRWRRGGAHVLAAIVLATSIEYALLSRFAVTDVTLTFFVTLGFLAVARNLESPSPRTALLAGAAFGLATLTKGPVGLIVPAVALAGYGVATRRRELLARRALIAVAIGFSATAAPWYIYMLAAHRDLVVTVFLGQGNLGRFIHPEHRQVPLFYVWVLAAGLMPWSGALPAGLARAFRDWRGGEDRSGSPGTVFALAWFAAVIGVFSLSASKLATYVLPAFPAAAFLVADYCCGAFGARASRAWRGPVVAACLGAAVSCGGAVSMLLLTGHGRFHEAGAAIDLLAAVLIGGAAGAVAAAYVGRIGVFAAVQSATSVAAVLVLAANWPALDAAASTRALVRKLSADGLADQLAGAYRVRDVSLDFYLGRSIPRTSDVPDLVRRVTSDPDRLWVVLAGDAGLLAARAPLNVEPVFSASRRAVVRLSPKAP